MWLVPGDWSRGKAIAWVAGETGYRFTELRARRAFYRFIFGALSIYEAPCWQFDDGVLKACGKTDQDAERYWEVDRAA
jgi:hypothetical protein